MSDTANYSPAAMAMLKTQLGYHGTDLPPEIEVQLGADLIYAHRAIGRAGIQLKIGDVYDDQMQAMYALWLYRKRREGTEKPQMLLQEIRDRQVANALSEGVSE